MPDYDHLRSLFTNALAELGCKDDGKFHFKLDDATAVKVSFQCKWSLLFACYMTSLLVCM